MGSESRQDCERPVHRVWVDAFLLAATQVTNADYATFLRATSTLPPPFWEDSNFNDPQQPVAGPSWFEAARYCEWLSAETARAYRLPTEAEWERAARGGAEQRNFPWGDEPPQSRPDYATRYRARACCPLRSQFLRPLRHLRERSRVVRRLVRPELLRNLARAQSTRSRTRPAQGIARRIVAASRKSGAVLGPFQHPSAISIRGLRFPSRP